MKVINPRPIPPKGSYVDSKGKRRIRLAIDIMVNHGQRFFDTFRYAAPVVFDITLGKYVIRLDHVKRDLMRQYESLRHRSDVVICIADAKPMPPLPSFR